MRPTAGPDLVAGSVRPSSFLETSAALDALIDVLDDGARSDDVGAMIAPRQGEGKRGAQEGIAGHRRCGTKLRAPTA